MTSNNNNEIPNLKELIRKYKGQALDLEEQFDLDFNGDTKCVVVSLKIPTNKLKVIEQLFKLAPHHGSLRTYIENAVLEVASTEIGDAQILGLNFGTYLRNIWQFSSSPTPSPTCIFEKEREEEDIN